MKKINKSNTRTLRGNATSVIGALIALALIVTLAISASAKAPVKSSGSLGQSGNNGPGLAPQVLPSLVRQIIHTQGNITTTVDNWGLIGGYSGISEEVYPSGEWPRNSNHSYLAEMKYWMGAVKANGDTIVSNTAHDFQPLPSLRTSVTASPYNIFVSTDSLSYDFDASDTIGLGVGSAARGWRVWNNDSAAWLYNQIYSAADSAFTAGGPVAVEESHYRFDDGARGSSAVSLGLEMTQTVYQWNYCYNEDFLFVVVDIKNVSPDDYTNFAFGLYTDIDVGGFDPSTGENGRLNDVVDYDTANGLAWTYDVTGYDAGWSAKTGVMGTKYIETPNNLGMSAFRTGLWDDLPLDQDEDPDRFALISASAFDTPLAPDDQYYLQCTNGINLTSGSTVRVVYAIIAGEDEADFRSNADLAQSLYDNYFVGPQPPTTPTLSVRPAEGRVYLSWDNVAEASVDPLSGSQDFLGYRIYRSANLGGSWGDASSGADGGSCGVDWDPIATFKVGSAGDPAPHSFVDTNVINGVEYWYCLAAYDSGDTGIGVDQLQSAFGSPRTDRNVIRAYPDTHPAGYYDALSTIARNQISDSSNGAIWPITLDPITAGSNIHKVVFYEDAQQTYWAVVDTVTGDTVLSDQTMQFVHQELISDSLLAFYPIANGMQVAVFNGERTPGPMVQTGFAGVDTTMSVSTFYGATNEVFGVPQQSWGSDAHFRSTYEIRFTAGGSTGADLWDGVTPMTMPFEIWNVTTNERLHVEVFDFAANGVYDAADGDAIAIVNLPYDGGVHPEAYPTYHAWLLELDPTIAINAQPGDVITVTGASLNGPSDEFYFAPDGINASLATDELADIKVVPNPYFARAERFENNTTPTRLQFMNLPNQCTIRVYTLAGDLVRVLEHDADGGDAAWDLLSEGGRQIASGVYFYHVESNYGEHLGRFAVIK